jgi:hypothetical protein
MVIKKLLINFVFTFFIALAATALVTFLWNLFKYGNGFINWQAAISIAIAISAIVTWVKRRISLFKSQ